MSDAGLGRLLVVDDEQSVREVLAEYFTEHGYEVVTADDGKQALAALRTHRPDLVLLDVRMPGLDGVETLRRLREIAPTVAVIMVTANEDVDLARDMLKIGAIDYVAKPFDFGYLERAVMAGLTHAGGGPASAGDRAPSAPASAAPASAGVEPWRGLAHAVFRAVRGMPDAARASTGARLEEAMLRAAREAAGGRREEATTALGEVQLLLGVAADLGDLGRGDVAEVEGAVAVVRRALGAQG